MSNHKFAVGSRVKCIRAVPASLKKGIGIGTVRENKPNTFPGFVSVEWDTWDEKTNKNPLDREMTLENGAFVSLGKIYDGINPLALEICFL